MEEVWKDIPGYEGTYQISNLSQIRSLDRIVKNSLGVSRKCTGRLIVGRKISNKGYLNVALNLNGIKKHIVLHVMVAKLFVENSACLPQVNHKDGNKRNNTASNLEWVSCKDNIKHSILSGLKNRGVKALDTGSRFERYSVL